MISRIGNERAVMLTSVIKEPVKKEALQADSGDFFTGVLPFHEKSDYLEEFFMFGDEVVLLWIVAPISGFSPVLKCMRTKSTRELSTRRRSLGSIPSSMSF
ncbi:MAG: hypothetical protein WBP42_14585 [Candidatus Zixiibacteriota bacterium]